MSDMTTNEVVEAPVPKTPPPSRTHSVLHEIAAGNALSGILAVVLAFLVGSIMIAATDGSVQEAAGYFFARPADFFGALGTAVGGAYEAMFRGAVFNPRADSLAGQLRPLTETLKYAAPLILLALFLDGAAVVLKRVAGVKVLVFQRANLLVTIIEA